MKQVLFVEDDEYKLDSLLQEALATQVPFEKFIAKSFTSAAHLLKRNRFDLIVLDMSLPTFESNQYQREGAGQGFGGKRLVRLASEYGNSSPTLLVTQFKVYEGLGKKLNVDDISIELKEILGTLFRGTIAYDRSSEAWIADYRKTVIEVLSHDF